MCSFRDAKMVLDDRTPICSGWDWGRNVRMVGLQQTGKRNCVDPAKKPDSLWADSGNAFAPRVRYERILQVGPSRAKRERQKNQAN